MTPRGLATPRKTLLRKTLPRRTLPVWLALLMAVMALPAGTTGASAASPFRSRHYDLADLSRSELTWSNERRLGFPVREPTDRYGVPMVRRAGGVWYTPGNLATSGMKRLDAYEDTGNELQLQQALKQARRLRLIALHARKAWWMPWPFDYAPFDEHAPWFDAMAQGLVLSFFVRLHRATGDDLHMQAAKQVFRAYLRFRRPGKRWIAYVDERGYLWLEHYPRRRPDHVLNGHMHATFAIYEFWQATGSKAARRLLDGAITTMRDNVHRYRRPGGISTYDLGIRSVITHYHYHHIYQLRLLARISGDRYFWRMARRFISDSAPHGYVPGKPARVLPPWQWPENEQAA